MFESDMLENIAQQSALKAIQGESSNTRRKLVSEEFTSFLDSISTVKQETTEEKCDEI